MCSVIRIPSLLHILAFCGTIFVKELPHESVCNLLQSLFFIFSPNSALLLYILSPNKSFQCDSSVNRRHSSYIIWFKTWANVHLPDRILDVSFGCFLIFVVILLRSSADLLLHYASLTFKFWHDIFFVIMIDTSFDISYKHVSLDDDWMPWAVI